MDRDDSGGLSVTRPGRARSNTTRYERWEKVERQTVAASWLSQQSTPTLQVASGFGRGRVRGDGGGQGMSVPHAPARLHQRQEHSVGMAIFPGTKTPPRPKRQHGDSPRFRSRARPLATPPPKPKPKSKSKRRRVRVRARPLRAGHAGRIRASDRESALRLPIRSRRAGGWCANRRC